MKKIVLSVTIALTLGLTGCTRRIQGEVNNLIYTSPKKDGKRYTVIQNGYEFPVHHLKCIYWSTDDDSVFEAENGKKIYVNGSSIIIEE